MTTYYFDTLPVHPQPAALESLSSYLTRLAQANGSGHDETTCSNSVFQPGRSDCPFRPVISHRPLLARLPTLSQCTEARPVSDDILPSGQKV